jgi:hypothetical protein
MEKRGLNRRGQLTLFIIFGILIVVGFIAFFLILPTPDFFIGTTKDPLQEIRPCIAESLEKVLPEFLEKGFYFNPPNSLIYQDDVVAYHCYTSAKRTICIRNTAQSKQRIEGELKNKISNDVENCFNDFKNANKGIDVGMGSTDLSIEVLPGKITIKTRKEITLSRRGEEPITYNNFDISINSPLWDLIRLSNEIINQEVSCDCPRESCTADVVELMRGNINYKITFFMGGRGDDKVYTIGTYHDEDLFKFAVRNCDKTP